MAPNAPCSDEWEAFAQLHRNHSAQREAEVFPVVRSEIQIHLQAILDAKKASGHDLYKRGEQAVADNDQALFNSLMQEMQKLYDDALSGSGDMYSSQNSSNRSGGSGIMTRAESSASDTVSPIGVSDPSASSQSKSRVPGSTTSGLSLRSQSAIEESGRGAVTSQSSTTNYGTNPQDQEVRADVADTRTRDERKFDAKVERNTPARWEEGVSESNKKRLSDDGHFWTDSNIMLVVPNDSDLLPNMQTTAAPMLRAKMDRVWDAVDASPDNSAPLEFMGQLPGDADAYDVYGQTIAIDRHKLGLVEELFGPVKYFGTAPGKPVAAYNRNGLKVAVIMPFTADDGDISILRQRWNNRPSPAASSDNQQQTQVTTQAKQEETPPREPDAAVITAVANARNTYNQEYNYSGSTENALAKVEEIIASVDPALQQAVRDEIGDMVTWGENLRLQFGHPADARRSGDLKTPEREMLRERLANKLVQDQITLLGDKARYEDELILIVGGPGAGKTSTQNAVVETEGAIVLDPDVIKPLLPEYEALGPQFVHDESTHVLRLALVIAADMDINTIVTGTGRDGTYLKEKIVAPFKERGYSVHGVLVEISPETAIGRVAQRVSEGGHGVHPDVIRDATLKAAETFGIMVNEGFYDGYIGLWNETPLGAPPDIRLLGPGVGKRLRDRFERQSATGSERDANSQRGSNSESVSGRTGRVSRGAAGRGAQGDRRGPAPAPGAVPSGNESEVSENAEVTTGADDLPAHVAGLLSPEQLEWVKRVRSENNARRDELKDNRNKRIKDMRDKRRGAVDITLEDFEWVARNAIESVLQGIETLNEAFGRLVFEECFRDDEIR